MSGGARPTAMGTLPPPLPRIWDSGLTKNIRDNRVCVVCGLFFEEDIVHMPELSPGPPPVLLRTPHMLHAPLWRALPPAQTEPQSEAQPGSTEGPWTLQDPQAP